MMETLSFIQMKKLSGLQTLGNQTPSACACWVTVAWSCTTGTTFPGGAQPLRQ